MRLKVITEELVLTLEIKTSLMGEASMKEGKCGEVIGTSPHLISEEVHDLEQDVWGQGPNLG